MTNKTIGRDRPQDSKPSLSVCQALVAPLLLGAAMSLPLTARAQSASYYQVPLRSGWNVLANHLSTGRNTLGEVMPYAPPGSVFYHWDAPSQTYTSSTFDPEAGVWSDPSLPFGPGEGGFLMNPTSPSMMTFIGQQVDPRLPLNLPAGHLALVARQMPSPATYEEITGLPPVEGTRFYRYDPVAQGDPRLLSNWHAHTFSQGQWAPEPPAVNLGEPGFVLQPDPLVIAPFALLQIHQGEVARHLIVSPIPDGHHFTFNLLSGGLPGVQLDPTTGLLIFDSNGVEPSTNQFMVDVIDDANPAVQGQQTVQVEVFPRVRIQAIERDESDVRLTWNSIPGREYVVRAAADVTLPKLAWERRALVLAVGESTSWAGAFDKETPHGFYDVIPVSSNTCDCVEMEIWNVTPNHGKAVTFNYETITPTPGVKVATAVTVEVPSFWVKGSILCGSGDGKCDGNIRIEASATCEIIDTNGAVLTNGLAPIPPFTANPFKVEYVDPGKTNVDGPCSGPATPFSRQAKCVAKFPIPEKPPGPDARARLAATPPTAWIRATFTFNVFWTCNGPEKGPRTLTMAVDGRPDNPAQGRSGHFDRGESNLDGDKKANGDPKKGKDESSPDEDFLKRYERDLDPKR